MVCVQISKAKYDSSQKRVNLTLLGNILELEFENGKVIGRGCQLFCDETSPFIGLVDLDVCLLGKLKSIMYSTARYLKKGLRDQVKMEPETYLHRFDPSIDVRYSNGIIRFDAKMQTDRLGRPTFIV